MAIFGPYLRERIDEGYRRLARELHKQPLPLLPLPTGNEGHTPLRSHPAVANHHARQLGCQAGPTERAPTVVGAPTRVTGDPPDGPRAPYASGASPRGRSARPSGLTYEAPAALEAILSRAFRRMDPRSLWPPSLRAVSTASTTPRIFLSRAASSSRRRAVSEADT